MRYESIISQTRHGGALTYLFCRLLYGDWLAGATVISSYRFCAGFDADSPQASATGLLETFPVIR
jgi:hypothetical protein